MVAKDNVKAKKERRAAKKPTMKRHRILRVVGDGIGKVLLLAARSIWEDHAEKAKPNEQSRVHRVIKTIGTAAGKLLLLAGLILVVGIRVNTQPMPAAAVQARVPQAAQFIPPPPVGQCDLRDTVSAASAFEAGVWNQIRSWCGYIIPNAQTYQLDPYLIAAVMWVESHGNPQSYSHSGAVGLMQVMPSDGIAATFRNDQGQPYFSDRPTMAQLFDPAYNIAYGAALLAQNIMRTGSLRGGLSAYGPENVGYTYADAVLAVYDRLRS